MQHHWKKRQFCCRSFAGKCRTTAGTNIFIGKYAGMGCNGASGADNVALGSEAEDVEPLVIRIFYLVILPVNVELAAYNVSLRIN